MLSNVLILKLSNILYFTADQTSKTSWICVKNHVVSNGNPSQSHDGHQSSGFASALSPTHYLVGLQEVMDLEREPDIQRYLKEESQFQ